MRTGVNSLFSERVADRQRIRQELGLHQDAVVVLAVSILSPWRRLDLVLDVIARLKHEQIVFYVSGPSHWYPELASKLRSQAKDLGLQDRFVLNERNLTSDEELHDLCSMADLFVFPNQNQTWGLAVIEAMASGLPCLVSTGAGVSEVLEDGETALLFDPNCAAELEKKLDALVTNRALRRQIGERARGFVLNNYSWERYAQQMLEIFSKARKKGLP